MAKQKQEQKQSDARKKQKVKRVSPLIKKLKKRALALARISDVIIDPKRKARNILERAEIKKKLAEIESFKRTKRLLPLMKKMKKMKKSSLTKKRKI